MDLTNVKYYLQNYFKKNIFDLNKYDNQDASYNGIRIPKLISGSCATSNYIVDLTNGNNGSTQTDPETGEECTIYPNGITECTDPDNPENKNTCMPNGTCVKKTNDGCVTTIYPDGTIIKECPPPLPFAKEILYANGLCIRENEDGVIIEIKDHTGVWVDFTSLENIFAEFRTKQNTSETIKYLIDVYKLFYRNEISEYNNNEFDSYFIEYIVAKITYNNSTYQVIQESTFYNDVFRVLDDLQKTREDPAGEMLPNKIVKSIKFWNYLTIIISAKNKTCPRFPLTMVTLQNLYNQKNSGKDIKLKRDNMQDLSIDDLLELTDIVDEYTDEPAWKDNITNINGNTILNKEVKMGGTKLYQKDTIKYGNFALHIGKKSIEFIVYDHIDENGTDILEDKMNETLIERNKYDNMSNKWICKMPDTGTYDKNDRKNSDIVERNYWLDIYGEDPTFCENDNESGNVLQTRNILKNAMLFHVNDIFWLKYISDFYSELKCFNEKNIIIHLILS